MHREGEKIIMIIKYMVDIIDSNSRKLFGQCDRFDLQYDLGQFWFTVWFGTVLIYSMIWNSFNLQYDLGQF